MTKIGICTSCIPGFRLEGENCIESCGDGIIDIGE